ncbi:glycosyltransferase family 4 protein [Aggregatibacter actinomycetemcomitans]|uniref:glycosyltransferase n=1 Tax=Aggregatibacter actinomycetemcomitans TaxID=714 RepID=UPI0011DC929A|nr:glycosyltransferase [Aggregatibacter actinomycetemcomitans]QEH44501.1 glycosyltransferase family 4 protein [Aggregatibacter actinomycetemcomitans]
MRIWFDISNISYWQGGIVGVIRAELELAYNFSKISDNILFCRVNSSGDAIEAVTREELSWLLNASTAVDGFIQYQKVYKESKKLPLSHFPKTVDNFYSTNSKLQHISLAIKFFSSLLPMYLGNKVYKFSIALENTVNRYRSKYSKILKISEKENKNKTDNPSYPFYSGDVIFSAGWKDSNKENLYKRIKMHLNGNLYLSYLIYDTILINKNTKHLYSKETESSFYRYFSWISENCDLIFYGGKTAMLDSQEIQKQKRLSIPKGIPIRFGDLPNPNLKSLTDSEITQLFDKLNIVKNKYLLCVGSIEPRKNHSILYKAYREIIDNPDKYNFSLENLPKLVFVGKLYGSEELVYNFRSDPKLKSLVVFISPTDEELDSLYKYCIFTLMPTLYEGWNLTMPESLSYNKFCISSNVAPMIEIGKDLVEYADPYNPIEWAKLIAKYCSNNSLLFEREEFIRQYWKNYSWYECAKFIFESLNNEDFPLQNMRTTLWYDLTLVNNLYRKLDGIPRVQLSMAWELYHKDNLNIRFFEFSSNQNEGTFVELPVNTVPWLSKPREEYVDFYYTHQNYKQHIYSLQHIREHNESIESGIINIKNLEPSAKRRLRISLLHVLGVLPISVLKILYSVYAKLIKKEEEKSPDILENTSSELSSNSIEKYKAVIDSIIGHPFHRGDIVLSMGLDWGSRYLQGIDVLKKTNRISSIYFIYDMIPLLEPNFYEDYIHGLYEEFFYWVCKTSDQILFGGKTALNDGKNIQKKLKIDSNGSMSFLRLGSEFSLSESASLDKNNNELKKLGIDRPFILSVGTFQIRKNHEVVYRALLQWLKETPEEEHKNLPIFVFAGRQGWLVKQLVKEMESDERVQRHLILMHPSDDELDILYKNCLFTVLPSLYEGDSLAMAESLACGKLCIASDVPPLRETGEGFADFVEPRNPQAWKEKCEHYFKNPKLLRQREKLIRNSRAFISWDECADNLLNKILNSNK